MEINRLFLGKNEKYFLKKGVCFLFTLFFLMPGCSKNIDTISGYIENHTQKGNYWLAKKQYRYAVTEYRNVLEFSQYYTPALMGLAQVNIETEKTDEAITLLRLACDNDLYNKEPFLKLVQLYISLDSYSEADDVLIEAMTYSPEIPEYYITRGIVYEKMGIPEQAALMYKKAITLDDNLGVAYNNLANVLFQLERYKLAKKYLDMAISNKFDVNPKMKASIEKNFLALKKEKK